MQSSKGLAVATLFVVVAAHAAHVDMTDPRRALGRGDGIRVDAQLIQETVTAGTPVGINYQIENLTQHSIAVADKVCDLTYDDESHTIILSIGSEVPSGGQMPHLIAIAPGQKKTLTTGAVLHMASPTVRTRFTSIPQSVEIKVNVLRDVAPFRGLMEQQAREGTTQALTDKQFDQWLESIDTILLNDIPVHFVPSAKSNIGDASQR